VHTAAQWWAKEIDRNWESRRAQALALLARDAELSRIVNLVGPEALSSAQRWELEGAALIKEAMLQQSALDPVDTFCSPQKQFALLDLALTVYDKGAEMVNLGVPVQELQSLPLLAKVRRCKSMYSSDQLDGIRELRAQADKEFENIRLEYAKQREHAE
jgi:V/A-type H+-transporting ATPase subunit A